MAILVGQPLYIGIEMCVCKIQFMEWQRRVWESLVIITFEHFVASQFGVKEGQ